MATTVLDELLVGLGFDYDEKDLDRFKAGIDDSINLAKKFIKVVTGMAVSLTALTVASTAASDEQGKLAFDIGSTVDEIDALQFANRRAGGTADGMAASLKSLAVRASEAARGVGSGVEAFGLLGIEILDAQGVLKPTIQLLGEVSDKLKGLDKARQIELSDKLGIGGSLRTLQLGSSAIKDLTDEARAFGVTTKEDAFISMQFQDSLVDIWQIMKQISRVISRTLAPLLKEANNQIAEWWINNRKLIEQDIPGFIKESVKWLKLMGVAFAFLISAKLIGGLFLMIKALKGISIWAAISNVAVALLPILIGVLVLAIAVLAFEANEFFKGNDNLFSRLIKRFPEYEKAITDVTVVFKAAFKTFKTLMDIVLAVFTDSDTAWEDLNKDFQGYKILLDTIRGTLRDIVKLIKDIGSGAIIDKVGKNISGIGQQANAPIKQIIDATINSKKFIDAVSGFTGERALSSRGNLKAIQSKSFVSPAFQAESERQKRERAVRRGEIIINNKIDIKIDGSKDPSAVADEVQRKLTTRTSEDLRTEVDQ